MQMYPLVSTKKAKKIRVETRESGEYEFYGNKFIN